MDDKDKLKSILQLFQSLDINQAVHRISQYFQKQIEKISSVQDIKFFKYNHKSNTFKLIFSICHDIEYAEWDPKLKIIAKNKNILIEKNNLYIPLIFLNKTLGIIYVHTSHSLLNKINKEDLKLDADLCSLIYYNSSIYSVAIKDELTKIYNLRYFNYKINEYYDLMKSNNEKMSVIMMDIDYFKHYNDKYGHHVGDHILRIIASEMNKLIGQHGLLARYGGEEFIALIPHSNHQKSHTLAENIRKQIENLKIQTEKYFWKITISSGISVFPDHADSIKDLIHKADLALYHSKNTGRNRVTLYEPNLK